MTHIKISQLLRAHAHGLVAALCLGSFATALALQHVWGMEPCPLCIVQRYFLLLCGICALAGACVRSVLLARVASIAVGVSAAGGLATAARHMWVQVFPPPSQGCLPGLDYMLEQMPLTRSLPMLFRGSADCSTVDTLVFGITIPQASAAVFVAAIALMAARRSQAK